MNLVKTNLANKEGLYVNPQGKLVQSSLQTAKMLGMKHHNLLTIIHRHIEKLSELSKVVVTYFIEAKYKSGTGKLYNCYELTQEGFYYLTTKLNSEIALKAQIAMSAGYNKALSIVMDESVNLFLEQGLFSVKWYIMKTGTQDIYARGLEQAIGKYCTALHKNKHGCKPQQTKDVNYKFVNVYEEDILEEGFDTIYYKPIALEKLRKEKDKEIDDYLLNHV